VIALLRWPLHFRSPSPVVAHCWWIVCRVHRFFSPDSPPSCDSNGCHRWAVEQLSDHPAGDPNRADATGDAIWSHRGDLLLHRRRCYGDNAAPRAPVAVCFEDLLLADWDDVAKIFQYTL